MSSQLCSYTMHRRFPPQPLLPGLAEQKGAVGIRPNHLLAATTELLVKSVSLKIEPLEYIAMYCNGSIFNETDFRARK